MNERDRWLVIEGYIAGYLEGSGALLRNMRIVELAQKWLDSHVADAVTTEMALELGCEKYSPAKSGEVEKKLEDGNEAIS